MLLGDLRQCKAPRCGRYRDYIGVLPCVYRQRLRQACSVLHAAGISMRGGCWDCASAHWLASGPKHCRAGGRRELHRHKSFMGLLVRLLWGSKSASNEALHRGAMQCGTCMWPASAAERVDRAGKPLTDAPSIAHVVKAPRWVEASFTPSSCCLPSPPAMLMPSDSKFAESLSKLVLADVHCKMAPASGAWSPSGRHMLARSL